MQGYSTSTGNLKAQCQCKCHAWGAVIYELDLII
jgi:hypothetical protein